MYHPFAEDMHRHTSTKPQNARLITSKIQDYRSISLPFPNVFKSIQMSPVEHEEDQSAVARIGVNLRNVSWADRCLLDHESSLLLSFANQFLPPSAPAFHSTLSPPQSDCSVGVCIHHLSSRLLQLYSSQSASTNFGTAAESP